MSFPTLTPRQLQVATLIKEGHSNSVIGKMMTVKTMVIKNYLREIYDRTGMNNRLELAIFMVNHEVAGPAPASEPEVYPRAVFAARAVRNDRFAGSFRHLPTNTQDGRYASHPRSAHMRRSMPLSRLMGY